jgi:hypothetical protein
LIVIKNQNIIKHYNDEELDKAFGYADDVLKNAVKCIAELITVNSEQNIDFNDINSIMRNSGVAMLGIAEASGENRIDDVLQGVLKCPLLTTEEHISNARNFLFSISYGSEQKLRIRELEKLTDKFEELKNQNSHVIWGRSEDPSLENKIKLSMIISKYDTADIKTYDSIGDLEKMYDGEKQHNANIVDTGTTSKSPSSPVNMQSVIDNEPAKIVKEDDNFGFLNKSNAYETKKESVIESATGFTAGPQKLRSTYDIKYEDDDQFSFLVDTPAIQRIRQEDKEDFQEKALKDNYSSSFMLDEETHAFFKNLPD